MINPLEQLEFLEKQYKTSSGIMMVLGYTMLGIGFLFVYASTMDVIIKDKVWFGLGGAIGILSLIVLFAVYNDKYKKERLLWLHKSYSSAIQMLKDDLDLRIKLIEYNEKAIAHNEKNKSPKLQIINEGDLDNMVKQYFEALFFKKP